MVHQEVGMARILLLEAMDTMKEAAIWILAIYSLANAGIVYYFFIYKQNKIDKEYNEQLDRIRRSYSHPPRKER